MNDYQLTPKQLYEETNDGLDIIHKYFPISVGCERSSKHKFKFRSEKTASATLYHNGKHWIIKDFGGNSYDAVNAVMYLTGLEFYETLQNLYAEFGVSANDKTVYAPNLEFKENKKKHPANYFKITPKKEYESLDYFGKLVTSEIAERYNVFEVEKYERITKKEGKLLITNSTDKYPIFAYSNNLKKWAKTYQPAEFKRKNKEGKTVNFKHGYLGKKDNDYIHGLDYLLENVNEEEINSLFDELSRTKIKSTREDILNEIKELQVKNVIICSGGSDGLNVASLSDDYFPIWFNSEGQFITYEQYQRINKLCQNFYNLPDIDDSGIRYAHTLANKYWNLKTIWLPSHKMPKNGKDFRDWLNFYSQADKNTIYRQFENLKRVALKCNFIDINDKGVHKVNLSNFQYFLNVNNYYSYRQELNYQEDNNENTSILVKIDNNVVSVPESSQVLNFTIDYLKDKGVDLNVLNLIKRARAFQTAELKTIKNKTLDFKNYTANSQLFYFKNGSVEITADKIDFISKNENKSNKYVWEKKVITNNFKKLDKFFEYYRDDSGKNRIKILYKNCDFMNYLINGSRVYWRKEIEEPFDTVNEQEAYRKANLFTLNGKYLTTEEQITQEQHFLNKCFALGYLLHRFKREDFAKFVYIMDDTVKESDDDANGGTGKSLLIRGLKEILNVFYIDGKDTNLTNNNHLLGGLKKDHDILNIEDGSKSLTFDYFYNKVTGDVDINPKQRQGHTLDFNDSPKFVGTFNYGMNKNRGSDLRRVLFVSFGDYYHAHTDRFNNERKVSDDFGYQLFLDWNTTQYNEFYNFLMQCCQLYLANMRNEFKAPMDNITVNNLKAQIGDNFIEWAEDYFSDDAVFNKNIIRKEMVDSYIEGVGKKSAFGPGRFKKSVEKFCNLNGWVFNPKRFRNSQGKIQITVYKEGTQKKTSKECFYIENLKDNEQSKPLNDGSIEVEF